MSDSGIPHVPDNGADNWKPPNWLLDFVQEALPIIAARQQELLDAMDRWRKPHAKAEQWLEYFGDVITAHTPINEQLVDAKRLTVLECLNLERAEFPLPLDPTRNYTGDEMRTVLVAIHDATRRPRDRLRSTERGVYAALCLKVRDLTIADLPILNRFLRTVAVAEDLKSLASHRSEMTWEEAAQAQAASRPRRPMDKLRENGGANSLRKGHSRKGG